MALKENKKQEWEENLREAGLMDASDSIEEHTGGDYWKMASQKRGNFFFTKRKFIFVGAFSSFAVNYSDITGIKKCMINFFIPTGIMVTANNQEDGKTKKYKCSVLKRGRWIEYLSQKAGVSA